jgi:transposase
MGRRNPRDPNNLARRWRDLIGRRERSDLTVRAFCSAHRVSEPRFYAGRRELAARDRARTLGPRDPPGLRPRPGHPTGGRRSRSPHLRRRPRPGRGRPGGRGPARRRSGGRAVQTLGLTGRIWLCIDPVDGRGSSDGLARVVTSHLAGDPLSGDLFALKNRWGDRLKILAWQCDGFALYMRRLERGTFQFPKATADGVEVTATDLALILGGIDLGSARRKPRYGRAAG